MRLQQFVERPAFTNTVLILIIFNSILVGLETSEPLMQRYGHLFHFLDLTLLWLFTIEIGLRLIAARPTLHFFKNGWNVFDFIIVMCGHLWIGGQFITVLRVLRILRIFRTISIIPSLRKMVNALIMSIPALGNIILLMGIVFYVFGVMGTTLFSQASPEYFGSISRTLLTLFQMVTLDSWASGVLRPLLAVSPWAWLYFIAFIMVGSFIVINLFLGIIVNSIERAERMDPDNALSTANDEMASTLQARQEVTLLRKEIAELKELILQQRDRNA